MVENERVPGSTASVEGKAEGSEAAIRFERKLEELLRDLPSGHVDIVHSDGADIVLLGSSRSREGAEPVPFDVEMLVQLKAARHHRFDAGLAGIFRKHLAALHELQSTLPGLDDLDEQAAGASGTPPVTQIVHGLGGIGKSSLVLRLAESMSATEVPIRALRNPGKVLGELAENEEIARVTNHGKIVGWLVPATEAEQHVDDLVRQGRLRRGTPAPIDPIDIDGLERPLSEALSEARNGERT